MIPNPVLMFLISDEDIKAARKRPQHVPVQNMGPLPPLPPFRSMPPPPPGQPEQPGFPAQPNPHPQQWRHPGPTLVETDYITYRDIQIKSSITLAVLIVAAVNGWMIASIDTVIPLWLIGISAVGFIATGIVNIVKEKIVPALILLCVAFEGLILGGVSAFFNTFDDGIALNAAALTTLTVAVTIGLYKTRMFEGKHYVIQMFISAGLCALIYFLLSAVMAVTGLVAAQAPINYVLYIVFFGMAASTIIMDIRHAQSAVALQQPRQLAWKVALGLMVTLLWLYIYFLFLLLKALANSKSDD
ncbi:MAG: Bax inhibitor-1/YccA family protein [Actinomycetaceae bacterium]|nr:Bax inhibitor-1/YccA family protein [Actinomycetaceae bacterium]